MTYKPSFHGTSIVRNGTTQHDQKYLPNRTEKEAQ
jgi:hypothetical protein